MSIQRKSQIPKAPERSLVDSIAAPAVVPIAAPQAAPILTSVESNQESISESAVEPVLQPPVRRQRKPKREVYTSKMDPELKAWAMSFKPDEDFVEVVEQAVWILRLARFGRMNEAIAALEQASQPDVE